MFLEHTHYHENNSIAWITLNRPQVLNALNKKLWREIYETLDHAEKNENVRAIILTGAGRAFSSGDDIKEVLNLETPEEVKAFFFNHVTPAFIKVLSLPKPVVAAVNGLAYGGGCEIVMLCDLVVASSDATFAVPEALIGVIPPIAAVIGPCIVGKLNISKMMMTGHPLDAEEAQAIGLVNKVVPSGELMNAAEEMAKSTIRAAPHSVGVMKKLLNKKVERELRQSMNELTKILQTEEGHEGHRAFVEKGLPKWARAKP